MNLKEHQEKVERTIGLINAIHPNNQEHFTNWCASMKEADSSFEPEELTHSNALPTSMDALNLFVGVALKCKGYVAAGSVVVAVQNTDGDWLVNFDDLIQTDYTEK